MSLKGWWIAVFVSFALVMSGCVTTTSSPFQDKIDLDKAERAYIQIGYEHLNAGRQLEAKQALNKAIDINARSAGAYLGLGLAYERELEYKLADSSFKKAIRYDASPEHHFQYGTYLIRREKFRSARPQFEAALKDTVYVKRAQTFELLAFTENKLKREQKAIEYYTRAVALSRMMPNSYLGLANIHFERENYVEGYKAYRGYVETVRAKIARQSAATLWLGIQLAAKANDQDAISSLVLQLRNQFSKSDEYQLYLQWKANESAA